MGEATVVASSDAADSERRESAGLEKQTLVDRRRSPLILPVAAVLVVGIVGGAAWWWVSFTGPAPHVPFSPGRRDDPASDLPLLPRVLAARVRANVGLTLNVRRDRPAGIAVHRQGY